MSEPSFFQEALSDFTNEIAYGDAVKRLADEGYGVHQIMGQIAYPAPLKRVRQMVFERLCETKVLLMEEPDCSGFTEYSIAAGNRKQVMREICRECEQNGQAFSYLYCSFMSESEKKLLSHLDDRQREYIESLFEQPLYHRLDLRMREIVYALLAGSEYRTSCYFLKTKKKLKLI